MDSAQDRSTTNDQDFQHARRRLRVCTQVCPSSSTPGDGQTSRAADLETPSTLTTIGQTIIVRGLQRRLPTDLSHMFVEMLRVLQPTHERLPVSKRLGKRNPMNLLRLALGTTMNLRTLCAVPKRRPLRDPMGPVLLNDSRAECNCTNCPMKAQSVNTVLHNHVPMTQAQ